MALTRLPSFTLLTTDDFTFGNVTVSGNITANYLIGNGSQLTGLPASYTDTNANAAIDAKVTKAFIDNLNVDADTLDGLNSTAFATSAQGTLADSAVQPGDLATVATTGSYTDLTNKPTLFDGTYANLTGKPTLATVATTGSYTDLTNKPTLFDGEYSSLANKPALFDGTYANLTGQPTLGTAAATNANAYATAAQGLLADSAIQSGANISVFTNDSGYLVAANLSTYATQSYVGNAVANLVNSAPAALDTLNELATALGNDASYSTTITNALANKLSTSAFTTTADTWLDTKTTSNLSEGTNLYYTDVRANTAIDNRVTKTFVDNLSVVANIANIAYAVTGSNVSGQVSNALVAGTVYTNAQPNITSVGQLSGLTVTGLLTATGTGVKTSNIIDSSGTIAIVTKHNNVPGAIGISSDLTVDGKSYLGDIGNVSILGGSANYVLQTDGTGNLSWVSAPTSSGGGGGTVSSVALDSTVDTFTADGSTTNFTLTTTPANENLTFVNLDGVMQLKGSYSLTGNVVTLSGTPVNGAVVEITTLHTANASASSTTSRAIAMSILFGS